MQEEVKNLEKENKIRELEQEIVRLQEKLEMANDTNARLSKMVNSSIEKDNTGTMTPRPRAESMKGVTTKKKTPVGTAFITVNNDENGEIFEVFAQVGKVGSDVAADAEALGRLISLILRMPSPNTPKERAQAVIEQLEGIGSGNVIGVGKMRIMSLSDAIAQVLKERIKQKEKPQSESMDICPRCGNASLVKIDGKRKCTNCEYKE